MFWTNKEKQLMKNQIEELNNKLITQSIEDARAYYNKIDAMQKEYFNSDMKLEREVREHARKVAKLETENEKLRAQIDVLSKIQLKEDEYIERINVLNSELAVMSTVIENEKAKNTLLTNENKELKEHNRELVNKIYDCNTKDAVIVKPELPIILNTNKK